MLPHALAARRLVVGTTYVPDLCLGNDACPSAPSRSCGSEERASPCRAWQLDLSRSTFSAHAAHTCTRACSHAAHTKPPVLQTVPQGPGTYKIPSANDIPLDFRVALLHDAPNARAIHSSKAVGEPPFHLGACVFFALKEAVYAARKDAGLAGEWSGEVG